MYGSEMVALTKREYGELEMLRFSLDVTRMDGMRNDKIRGTAQVERYMCRGGMLDIWEKGC